MRGLAHSYYGGKVMQVSDRGIQPQNMLTSGSPTRDVRSCAPHVSGTLEGWRADTYQFAVACFFVNSNTANRAARMKVRVPMIVCNKKLPAALSKQPHGSLCEYALRLSRERWKASQHQWAQTRAPAAWQPDIWPERSLQRQSA